MYSISRPTWFYSICLLRLVACAFFHRLNYYHYDPLSYQDYQTNEKDQTQKIQAKLLKNLMLTSIVLLGLVISIFLLRKLSKGLIKVTVFLLDLALDGIYGV